MKQYHDLLSHIINTGNNKGDRTGTGTRSVFGYQMRFDLSQGFPLLTTKKVHFKSIVHELLWFIKGETNIEYLLKNKVSIWNEWALPNGDLGPVYGKQWRSWTSPDGQAIDQLKTVIDQIKQSPNSRRIIISAWNPSDLPNEKVSPQENAKNGKMALAPCHALFQFYVANGKLSCQLYQRSCDVFLGLPFNIASYALVVLLLANHCGLEPGEFIWTGGDTHIYNNHFSQVEELLKREPKSLPKLTIKGIKENIEDYTFEDFELTGYDPYPAIKATISI